MTSPIRIYAGPTLFGTGLSNIEDSAIDWLPPVKRGDIEKLLTDKVEVGTLAIVDGTFHSYPSVSHHEIRHAIEAGWQVYGLSSMGAIRACEMVHLGMKPFGAVAQRYLDDPDFNDDEVTLVHGVDAPYVPLSEPLIHMREFLSRMHSANVIREADVQAVLGRLQPRWYAERTMRELQSVLKEVLGHLPPEVIAGLKNFQPYRIKQADLLAFVKHRVWLGPASAGAVNPSESAFPS